MDRTATFASLASGSSLVAYTEGLLSITDNASNTVGFTAFSPTDFRTTQYFYPNGGNTNYAKIKGTDGAVIFALDFRLGDGQNGTTTNLRWQTYRLGVLTGSGTQASLVRGSIVGWTDATGFDEIRVAALFSNPLPGFGNPQAIAIDDVRVTVAVCGDAAVQSGEQCDDGNVASGDCCSATCQYETSGSSCGSASDSTCDNPDSCNGSGACQSNNEPGTTLCRAAAGICDVGENCTGSGACPADVLLTSTTTCRADAGDCDIAEKCSGASPACPADAFEPAAQACGSASDSICDHPDSCNGAGACHANNEPGTTLCRTDAGDCDVAENCNGSGACPADGFEPLATSCGSSGDTDCDNPDACDGGGACLPHYEVFGTICDDGEMCTVEDYCDGTGDCDAYAPLFRSACTWAVVGGGSLGQLGHYNTVVGDLCLHRGKVFAFTDVTGNVAATIGAGAKGMRFGEGVAISGDIATGGAGVFAVSGAFLPHLTPAVVSLAGGDAAAKDAVPGGVYDTSGTSPLIADCDLALGDIEAAGQVLDDVAAGQTHGSTVLDAGSTLTLLPLVPGGLNVIEYERLRGGADVTINVDGGGNPDTIMILRVRRSMRLRERATIAMTNGMLAKNFTLYVAAGRTDIGRDSTVAGAVYAGARLGVGDESVVDGQLFSGNGKVEIGESVVITLAPNEIVLP